MHPYLPHTQDDIKKMLDVIGVSSIDELFTDIPESIRLNRDLQLPKAHSELEVEKELKTLADLNTSVKKVTSFIGGGAYEHYIPSIIKHLTLRQEFFTAYTPYQPELSQGTLQAIFEYQSMICELTGMDVSNASLYDGGSSLAESVFMSNHGNKKKDVLISRTVNPEYRQVVETYARFNGLNYIEIEAQNGITDVSDLENKFSAEATCVIVQVPNYYGIVEEGILIKDSMDKIKHKAQFIVSANPISLGLLEAPANYGADIVVGEGQSLGNALSFGGPYLGFIATTKDNMRRMPGRIVGQALDKDGKRAYVLTLQAREQHIRREKAMSNITSNQGLNALMTTIYLSTMGKNGLIEVAQQCISKAHYLANKLTELKHVELTYDQPFFNEFLIKVDGDVSEIYERLTNKGFYSGIVIDKQHLLVAVTEVISKDELDRFVREMEVLL